MRKGIFVTALILLMGAAPVMAVEGEISGSIDFTYANRYIFRGIDTYPQNHSAIQPSIDVDLFGTGFGFNVWYSRANRSGFEETAELDYTFYYGNSFFKDEDYKIDYTVGWTYYSYPKSSRKNSALQEIFGSFAMPDICPAGFVPSYTVISTWPSKSNSNLAPGTSGYIHVFGLGYGLDGVIPNAESQTIDLKADLVYNDGAYAVDHDWSHLLLGASTDIKVGKNVTVTPAIYQQYSFEDTVNPNDETWFSVSVSYAF